MSLYVFICKIKLKNVFVDKWFEIKITNQTHGLKSYPSLITTISLPRLTLFYLQTSGLYISLVAAPSLCELGDHGVAMQNISLGPLFIALHLQSTFSYCLWNLNGTKREVTPKMVRQGPPVPFGDATPSQTAAAREDLVGRF